MVQFDLLSTVKTAGDIKKVLGLDPMTEPLTPSHILPNEIFHAHRDSLLDIFLQEKKKHFFMLGPDMSVFFENKLTVWWQIQEMLYHGTGTQAQLEEELSVYNPLIPQEFVLTATLMLEFTDPDIRKERLETLWNIMSFVRLGTRSEWVFARPLKQGETFSSDKKKAFSVNFMKFCFHVRPESPLTLEVNHPLYTYHLDLPPYLFDFGASSHPSPHE